MAKGFPQKALGIMIGTLLCGNVFAAGPVISDIPTVFITDLQADGQYDPDTPLASVPAPNLFRFSGAIDLATRVTDTDSALSAVEYLFTESDLGTPDTARVGAARTISINGQLGFDAVSDLTTIDAADVLGNSMGDVQTGGVLDFRNEFRSPSAGSIPFPDPGAINDMALVTVFVTDADSGVVDLDSFTVVTTNDGSLDRLSGASTIFTSEVCLDSFTGWSSLALNSFSNYFNLASPTAGTPGTGTIVFNPSTSPSSNAASLTSTTPVGGGTLAGFWVAPNADGITTTQGSLYMVRWTLSSNAAPGSEATQEGVRLRVGGANTASVGVVDDSLLAASPNHLNTTARTHRTWLEAGAAGTLKYFADTLDFSDTAPASCTVDRIELFSTTRAQLSGKTVIVNEGGTVSGAEPGNTNYGAWAFTTANTFRGVTTTGTSATNLQFNLSAGTTGGPIGFATFAGPIASGSDLINDVPAGKLVVMDVWASTSAASATLPSVRMGLRTTLRSAAGSNPGLANFFTINASNSAGNLQSLSTTPRKWTQVFEPQAIRPADTAFDIQPQVDIFFFDDTSAGNVQLNRITVTTYDSPAEPTTTCP